MASIGPSRELGLTISPPGYVPAMGEEASESVSHRATRPAEARARSGLRRRLNEVMRQINADDASGVFPFLCECDGESCFAAAWLTVAAYDHARRAGELIRATGTAVARRTA